LQGRLLLNIQRDRRSHLPSSRRDGGLPVQAPNGGSSCLYIIYPPQTLASSFPSISTEVSPFSASPFGIPPLLSHNRQNTTRCPTTPQPTSSCTVWRVTAQLVIRSTTSRPTLTAASKHIGARISEKLQTTFTAGMSLLWWASATPS